MRRISLQLRNVEILGHKRLAGRLWRCVIPGLFPGNLTVLLPHWLNKIKNNLSFLPLNL